MNISSVSHISNEALIISIAALVGFFGDALLQALVHFKVGNWGLKDYFAQHGRLEAMFIACGMMALFYIFYILLKIPLKIQYIIIYAILLDLLFRFLVSQGIFSSLSGYYKSLNYFWSAVWGIIPMLIPFLIFIFIQNRRK